MNKLYVVGIGPGNAEDMTLRAAKTLEWAEVIVGYQVYNDLVRPLFPNKEYLQTPMRRETERCLLAIETARSGKKTAVICSGDAGVYGMASLILELSEGISDLEVGIVPGVTAALSGGALLGAPLGHDFAVLSLSDALTPWQTIEKRLRHCAQAGLCMAIYNPASHKRPDHLKRACDILLAYLPPETACGVAADIGRENERAETMTLKELRDYPADMFTTVFVGTADTRFLGKRLVTPRGYKSTDETGKGGSDGA
ncbi:MAG: precorrin-3B C(17)-methyltransferase [Clostridia bacterium]|nr:precorrin-3B C(17)-methyltransferase [Clostridia bacterium]